MTLAAPAGPQQDQALQRGSVEHDLYPQRHAHDSRGMMRFLAMILSRSTAFLCKFTRRFLARSIVAACRPN